MLKFTNVCWNFLLIDYLKSKSNPIYLKQTKIIQDVLSIVTKKTKCKNIIFVITIFEGCNVLLSEGSILSGSLSSLWPTLFGLFACLDFGPCPLFLFLSLSLGAFFLLSLARFHQLIS
jgi:hypothetical protein